jgi:hypothetical protein
MGTRPVNDFKSAKIQKIFKTQTINRLLFLFYLEKK